MWLLLTLRIDRGAAMNRSGPLFYLVSKGWKTAIFERNAEIGGAVRTNEYTLPGFRHDFADNLFACRFWPVPEICK